MQHENMKKGFFFGLLGNILFIAFALICLLYYYTYSDKSIFSKILEILAYSTECAGFGLLIYADYLLTISVRFRRMMKVGFTAYIVLEALMMFLELNSWRFSFYAPYSLPLAIIHSIICGAVCFGFLQLDPENKRFEYLIIASIAVVLLGMMGCVMGIRVYFSIGISTVGQAVLFGGILSLLDRQQIEIDCYGDRAEVHEYSSSTLFSGNEEKKTDAQLAAAKDDTGIDIE